MHPKHSSDGPPSYDMATGQMEASETKHAHPQQPQQHPHTMDVKVRPDIDSSRPPMGLSMAGPSPISSHRATTVYNYVNPRTGEHVVSLLPPDHPQMVCLQEGRHKTETRYGFLGILAAIVWFPLGIGLCLYDRRVYCSRCGQVIDNGLCG